MKQLHFSRQLAMLLLFLLGATTLQAQVPIRASSVHVYDKASQSTGALDTITYTYQGTRKSTYDPIFEGFGADQYSSWLPNGPQYDEFIRSVNLYDSKSNIVKNISAYVEPTGLDTFQTYDYAYDASDRIITRTSMGKLSSGIWYGEHKTTYTYDTQGDLVECLIEKWDLGNNIWVNDSLITNSYTNGKLIGKLTKWWFNNAWADAERITTHYNGANPDSILTEIYGLGTWDTAMLEVYQYDANNDNDTTTIFEYYTNWHPYQRSIYSYDNKHNRLSHIQQDYINSQSKFENLVRERHAYNAHGLLTSTLIDVWNNQTNQYEYTDGYVYMMFRHYEPVSAITTNETASPNFRIYPNPASSEIRVNLQLPKGTGLIDFAIYDYSGKIIRYWHEPYSAVYSKTIDVSAMPDGIYYIRCLNAGLIQKFIVAH